jgi:hypothetical protein
MGYYVNVYDGYTGQPIENAYFSDYQTSWSGPGDYNGYRYYVEISLTDETKQSYQDMLTTQSEWWWLPPWVPPPNPDFIPWPILCSAPGYGSATFYGEVYGDATVEITLVPQ